MLKDFCGNRAGCKTFNELPQVMSVKSMSPGPKTTCLENDNKSGGVYIERSELSRRLLLAPHLSLWLH